MPRIHVNTYFPHPKNTFSYLWLPNSYALVQDLPVTVVHNPGHQRNRESGGHPEDISPSGTAYRIFCPWRFEMPSAHRRPDIAMIDLVWCLDFVH
jgi:hypothetical protein